MILSNYLKQKKNQPFIWGQNDCVYFAARYAEIITGVNFCAEYPAYDNEADAYDIIKKSGGLESMVHRALGDGFSNHLKACRGDIVLFKSPMETLGIVDDTGQRVACVSLRGLTRIRLTDEMKFWRLECPRQ